MYKLKISKAGYKRMIELETEEYFEWKDRCDGSNPNCSMCNPSKGDHED